MSAKQTPAIGFLVPDSLESVLTPSSQAGSVLEEKACPVAAPSEQK